LEFKEIKALVFDFDGVFTDNRVIVSENGKESVICNRSDGIGLEMLRTLGIPMTIISTEMNPVVAIRAKKLKISVAYGVKNKIEELNFFSKAVNIDFENIAFIGNDINDSKSMEKVGFPIAVADAIDDIKMISSLVLEKKGGEGAVREFCELVFQSHEND